MTDILDDLAAASPEQIAEIAAILGLSVPDAEPEAVQVAETVREPKAAPSGKIRCKVCGFHKKPRKVLVDTGICGVCTQSLGDGAETVEVVGRSGKRGRNTVSVVIDGKRYKVKRLSSKHSERVAARYASKGKGYARKPKAHVSDIVSPKGLPTDSRIGADREQRTYEA